MFVKILGLIDLFSGIMLILLKFGFLKGIALFFAICLILKALVFITDFTSFIDIVAGIFLILGYFGVHNFLSWIFVVWLLQKGAFSLLS